MDRVLPALADEQKRLARQCGQPGGQHAGGVGRTVGRRVSGTPGGLS
jgi:hypothetical protein